MEGEQSEGMENFCNQYPVLIIGETLYNATGKECTDIGSEIGSFSVGNGISARDVTVFEIPGDDSELSVAVLFPETQKFFEYTKGTGQLK